MTQLSLVREVLPFIEFEVKGAPVPQGSKVALVSGRREKRGGATWVRNPMASMVDQADRKTKTMPAHRLKHWRERIADVASGLMVGEELWTGPIILECVFIIARRDSHFTSKGALTKSAPVFPQGDLDKLIRAVGDALSKVVYRDDVQITGFGGSTKRFSETAAGVGGVKVKVSCR